MGPRSIWGGGRLVVAPQVWCRRLVLANLGRVEQRAAEHRVEPAHGLDSAVVRDVRRPAEAETWVEVTPERLSALHEAGLPA